MSRRRSAKADATKIVKIGEFTDLRRFQPRRTKYLRKSKSAYADSQNTDY